MNALYVLSPFLFQAHDSEGKGAVKIQAIHLCHIIKALKGSLPSP